MLAYSGSLRTSVAIPWLKEKYGAEIVTATMDLGPGRELEAVRDRALACGALRAHVLDLREEFARGFVVPALKADAAYDAGRAVAPLLGRPLIAQRLVEIARMEQADAVAHGGGPAELDLAVRTLDPTLTVIATAVENAISHVEEVAYLRTRGLTVPAAADRPYRADANLWGRTLLWAGAAGVDDPWPDPPESIFALTRSPAACPDEPAFVDVSFDRGVPTAVNGVLMPIVDLIASLGTIVGAHGVGRSDRAETRPGNLRVRTVTEAPAAVALHTAHHELQRVASPMHSGDDGRFLRLVAQEYADIIAGGRWFTPLREALDVFVDKVQAPVTGVVRLRLFKGRCEIVGEPSAAPPRRTLVVTPG